MERSPTTWNSTSRSEVGKVRKLNEDAFLDFAQRRLWAVADGMGGHAAGDVASRLTVDTLAKVAPGNDEIDALVAAAKLQLQQVNAQLYQASKTRANQISGTTVVVLISCGDQVAVLWAGDSRVYRVRQGGINLLTTDHSRVQELLQRGEISASELESHPQANVITRAIGVTEKVEIEVVKSVAEPGDRFLLCSDGLTRELADERMAEMLAFGTLRAARDRLVEAALAGSARDNITAVLVEYGHGATDLTEINTAAIAAADTGADDDATLLITPEGNV